METRTYLAIDLKSFYASVECIQRFRDPLTTNLVVADESRTEKTICLAVSPSLKAYGISGRARLFEVVRKVREVNQLRLARSGLREFSGRSDDDSQVRSDPGLALDFITAKPRMALYLETSAKIYEIYLRYVAPEDIHVYSIDEVFIDATPYLNLYKTDGKGFARKLILAVLAETGITAAAGVGTNLYLAKVAMDIEAKHIPPDEHGVRVAVLDEMSYRRQLWDHRPLTDFWRVGRGYAAKLEKHGLMTMGDVARCSIGREDEFYNEELLYKLFGVNAELLIDHAWGWEPCAMAHIRAYRPASSSLGSGQVLHCPYTAGKARLVLLEMGDRLALDLVEKGLVTDQLTLTVGYDAQNLTDRNYRGPVTRDPYGRQIPKHAHGTVNLEGPTSSTRLILERLGQLYDRIVEPELLVRRLNVTACHVQSRAVLEQPREPEQLDLFTDYAALEQARARQAAALEKERKIQTAMLDIKRRFGKNAILKAMNLEEGATARDRNEQIGGHKA